MKKNNFILLTTIVLIINLLLDRVTKIAALVYLKGEAPITFLYDTMRLTYIENVGAFLSMGAHWPIALKNILLIVVPLLVCLYGIYYCAFREKDKTKVILIVSIIGGGIGNLVDRIFYNFSVIDFMNFGIGSLRTGILNVADLSVTFGVILLIIYDFKQKKNAQAVDDKE